MGLFMLLPDHQIKSSHISGATLNNAFEIEPHPFFRGCFISITDTRLKSQTNRGETMDSFTNYSNAHREIQHKSISGILVLIESRDPVHVTKTLNKYRKLYVHYEARA